MTQFKVQPGIMKIELYQGGQSAIAGRTDVIKLSSNENPLGPPPSAIEAITAAASRAHLYPSTDHANLRAAIAEVNDLDPDRIICGVGSDEVLQFITQSFSGPGDEIIHTRHGFSMYPILAHMAGATPVCVEEVDRRVDVDKILNAVTDQTRIVLLTNPGNPTGTTLAADELRRLVDALPDRVILVIDMAYVEYAGDDSGGIDLARTRPNVIMTRTFSKIYGLGGLRIGWGYGPRDIIDILNRVRQPFNLSPIQLEAAEAAVRDPVWQKDCAALNASQRARLTGAVRNLGFECDDSQTNFVLARASDEHEATDVDQALRDAGIIVRRVTGYGFPEGLRITVGDEVQTSRVIAALTKWKEGA